MAVAQEPIKLYGVKEAVAIMRQVQPEMLKQMRAEIRKIANPAVTAIKSMTPAVSPLRGMDHLGRTGWSAVNVSVSITPGQRSKAFGSTTSNLAAIMSRGSNNQFGFNIADMAGKTRRIRTSGETRPYDYKGGSRSHRLNGQGRGLIDNLPGKPSRYVYPAIESKLPQIYSSVADTVQRAIDSTNRKLGKY